MRFFLGTHLPSWLRKTDVDLFVSHRRLKDRVSPFPPALGEWALDSGGFTELNKTGRWVTTPGEYVESVQRYSEEIGGLVWASPQDWMCEPFVLEQTGLTVDAHQGRTVENYCLLRQLAPALPWTPVLQGWTVSDYHACAERYDRAGVCLEDQLLVGVGSVCRRQWSSAIEAILTSLAARNLRLHGFGVKTNGLARYSHALASADSMAWSFAARMAGPDPECAHVRPGGSCANCLRFALRWRRRLLADVPPQQLSLGVPA